MHDLSTPRSAQMKAAGRTSPWLIGSEKSRPFRKDFFHRVHGGLGDNPSGLGGQPKWTRGQPKWTRGSLNSSGRSLGDNPENAW